MSPRLVVMLSTMLSACLLSNTAVADNIFTPILKVLMPSAVSSSSATFDAHDDADIESASADDELVGNPVFNTNNRPDIHQPNADQSSSAQSHSYQKKAVHSPSHHHLVSEDTKPDASQRIKRIVVMPSVAKDNLTNSRARNAHEDSPSQSDTAQIILEQQKKRPSLYHVLHAEFLLDRGEPARALQIYKQQAFKKDATTVFERALPLSLRYESADTSLEFARAWQQQNSEHLPAQFYVAHLALKAFDYQTAGNTIGEILQSDPQADLTEILTGIYPSSRSDQQDLLTTLQDLPTHNNPSLLVMEAGLLSQLGNPELALVKISNALAIEPDTIPYITLKADIIDKLQPYQEVLTFIKAQRQRLEAKADTKKAGIFNANIKELYLYDIRYRLGLGQRLPTSAGKQQTQAAWQLLLAANLKFDDPEITLLASLVSLDIEAYATADELLSDLAALPAFVDRAYYYLGISNQRQERFEAAKRFFANVMQEDLVLDARQRLTALHLLDNNPDAALASLEKFAKQFPVYMPDSAVLQADILWQQGKTDAALAVLSQASQKFPDDLKLLFARTQLLDDEQDTSLKRQIFEHLLLLNPEDLTHQMAYAKFLFVQDNAQDTQTALQIANDILAIGFDDPNYQALVYVDALNLTMAEALADEQYQKVIDTLQSVYEVSPNLDTGIILVRAYQGIESDAKVATMLEELQNRFALGQTDLESRLQAY